VPASIVNFSAEIVDIPGVIRTFLAIVATDLVSLFLVFAAAGGLRCLFTEPGPRGRGSDLVRWMIVMPILLLTVLSVPIAVKALCACIKLRASGNR
jgi:hypothetical protein